jgi:hypothetical protein
MKRRHAKKNTLKQKVYTLLLKNLTVEEIASALGISDARVCSIIENILCDISKEIENNNSIGELLKEYKLCIDGLGEALREAWLIYHSSDDEGLRLKALRMIVQLYKARLDMLEEGQVTMKVKELIDEYEQKTKEST